VWTREADVYSFGALASEVLQQGLQPLTHLQDDAVITLLVDPESVHVPHYFSSASGKRLMQNGTLYVFVFFNLDSRVIS
jgi:hypothetical protein